MNKQLTNTILIALLFILCSLDVQHGASTIWYVVQVVGIVLTGSLLIKINEV